MLRRWAFAGAVSALLGLVVTDALGAAQRTFVASNGSPANTAFNCSIVKPCRAFSDAISVTSAGGEVIVLDSAGYGPVTITQSASIITPPGVYAGVSVFGGNGITVNGAGISVVLRGLQINGLGGDAGIVIVNAARVRIENCVVSRMSHMGIFHQAAAAQVTVSDTIVRDNADEGIRFVTSTGSITLERVTSEGNLGVGFYISPNSPTGLLEATISDSSFARNFHGVWADAGANAVVFASIDRSTLSENTNAGVMATGVASASVRVAVQRSTLRRNVNGVVGLGSAPSSVDINASENVLHYNLLGGIRIDGSGAVGKASGNYHDSIVCINGGTLYSYKSNSVTAVAPTCTVSLTPL